MSFSNLMKGFSGLFSVDNPVTSSSFDTSDDVVKTKNALADLGHFNAQTKDVGEGIKNFQSVQGLKVDGVMNPGGPTENALSQTLANQAIGNSDLLSGKDKPLPSHVTVSKPLASAPDTKSWTASASFGPMTGLADPLVQAPKGKMPSAKQWEEVVKLQQKKFKTVVVPQGDTVQQRIASMMQDNRYQDKNDTGLRDHVVKQFEKAYSGNVEFDETGKMIQPVAVIRPEGVEAYDPNGEMMISNHIDDFKDGPPHEYEQPSEEEPSDKDKEPENEKGKEEEWAEQKEEKKVTHPPVTRSITSGSTRLKLNNSLNIRVQSHTLLVDGVDIGVFFGNLDEDGRMHSLAPERIITFAFSHIGAKEETIDFGDTPYGWEAVVRILPSESRSDNSGGFHVQVQGN
jgi:hypothetical protein